MNTDLNPNLFQSSRSNRSAADYIEGILNGNRVILSQAITLLESTRPEHQVLAQEILEQCLPHKKESIRIGITGSPGVGKVRLLKRLV